MRKFLLLFLTFVITCLPTFAAKMPVKVVKYLQKEFNNRADVRFDGLITLPDGTVYLPLFPSRIKNVDVISVQKTYPENKKMTDLPDIVVFNSDFVLLKVIKDKEGNKTVSNISPVPLEVKGGLLPQDMLVPKGLVVPEGMKTIIGGLKIATKEDKTMRVQSEMAQKLNPIVIKSEKNLVNSVSALKNKVMYIMTCYSKSIQVVEGESSTPKYALEQKTIPVDMVITPDNKFLLITTYDNNTLDVISLKDEQVIKKIDLKTPVEEIILDKEENKVYVSSPIDSSIYLVDLTTMQVKQKIKVNGMPQKLYLDKDGIKLFYSDKNSNNIWCIDLDDDYTISEMGKFPNISGFAYSENKLYAISRTKNKLAIIDYATKGLIDEIDVPKTPNGLVLVGKTLYVLSGGDNTITVLNTVDDTVVAKILLKTGGFATQMYPLKNTNLLIVTDTRVGKYTVVDTVKKQVIKTTNLFVPVSKIEIVDKQK